MKRKHLHHSSHPFDQYPFETFWRDSWRTVEHLRIRGGAITTHVVENGETTGEDIPMSNLRLRSRKATESDCTCFLRPGVDICVFTSSPPTENSDEEKSAEPVWIDAKIRSIERKPHDFECACEFYVSLYVTQGPALMAGKMLSKEVNIVKIDQISILQKLDLKPSENEHYRWSFSEDCTSLQKLKLFTGRFSSDLTWLLVASVLKQTAFDVRSIRNKIVYEILDNTDDANRSTSENHSYAVNFKLDNGISAPIIVQFFPNIPEARPSGNTQEFGPLTIYNPMELRRSKRRYVQPDRYLGCDDLTEYDVDVDTMRFVSKTYKREQEEFEEVPLALSIQANLAREKHDEIEKRVYSYKKRLYENFPACGSEVKSIVSKHEVKDSSSHHTKAHKSHLAIVPVSHTGERGSKAYEQDPADLKIPEDHSGDIGDIFTRYMYLNGCPTTYKRKTYAGKFTESYGQRWARGPHRIRYRRRSRYSFPLRESIFDVRSCKKGSVSANVCRELIKRCMVNIDASLNKEQPPIIDQWEEFKSRKASNQKECNAGPSEDDEEISELDMLWKEMELALASCYLLDDNEETHMGSHTNVQMPSERGGKYCQHDYRLNEEIGIVCRLCGYVIIEIKNVSPTFLPTKKWIPSKEQRTEEDSEQKPYEVGDDDHFEVPASSNSPSSEGEGEDNVWALIPDLRNKLRVHQKKAFEFLWRNIAGSMVPAEMEQESKKRGGCVISHSPGAGKTLLIITFLVSYLKLFPGSRPLVLAPKTTLYTWYKEIIKWEIPVPVYQIHGGQTFKGEILRQKMKLNPGLPRNQDVMHVLDCLEKMQKWLAHPSILLMGYTSFLTLMREDSNYAHRKYMAQVLRQCPGILILDEGHNPRSTKSRLRKGLMKVNSKLRVLLSGTLFQNNFGEYFNTLCLARPNFVTEVLKVLDPKYKKRKEKTRFSLENRARKYFVDKISKKINSNVAEERLEGLNVLKNLTSGFIDIYEGSNSDQLPGLQCYTLMMKPTTIQQGILIKLQNQRPVYKGFPLELELLITLAAIHPWLIRTTACSSQYFTAEELESLEQFKFDLKLGSKVRFVMSLVPRCLMRKEKVLLFCHNIAPINLFLEIFERFYGWRKGEEVLVLSGEIELFERGRLIDKFEDPGGPSKVMLASITACAEGISLTAASRVILLDSEWNPSKSKQAIARAFRPGQEKVVYVYQLLATGTLEEEKYTRTTWKEYVSCMIFSEELVEDPSHWQAPKIEDELLREIVEEDRAVLFHKIMKNEKASNVIRGKNNVSYDNKED